MVTFLANVVCFCVTNMNTFLLSSFVFLTLYRYKNCKHVQICFKILITQHTFKDLEIIGLIACPKESNNVKIQNMKMMEHNREWQIMRNLWHTSFVFGWAASLMRIRHPEKTIIRARQKEWHNREIRRKMKRREGVWELYWHAWKLYLLILVTAAFIHCLEFPRTLLTTQEDYGGFRWFSYFYFGWDFGHNKRDRLMVGRWKH